MEATIVGREAAIRFKQNAGYWIIRVANLLARIICIIMVVRRFYLIKYPTVEADSFFFRASLVKKEVKS